MPVSEINDNKSIENLKITIDKSLVFDENDYELKTRVPGTYGDNIRYFWLKKDDIEEINNGKTILTALHSDTSYMLYDKNNKIAENILGDSLYRMHYDAVDKNTVKDETIESPSSESPSSDELRNDKFDNLNDVSEHKNIQILESVISDKSKISVPIISNIYDKSASKIAKLEDKNMLLTDKSHKAQLKIDKANRFIEVYNQISSPSVSKAVPAPLFNFIKLIAEQKQNKVASLQNKVEKHNDKIEANNKRIDKHTKRMETCEKVNVFLTNMKTSEGRQENFVVGLQEFQSMSLNRTTEKLATVNEKINNFSLAYENTHYASEKIKLRDKLAKLNGKKNKLEVKLEGLNGMGDKFTAVRETTVEKAETIISKSYDDIIKSAAENPDRFAKNQVDTVLDVCNNIIDNELFEHSEQKKFGSIEQEYPDNYLKNAEMALEDDYDSIDGIINNGSKEKEHKKLQETPDEHKQQTRSSKSPLSRKQIKANADKISKAEQNNDINKSKLKGQEL